MIEAAISWFVVSRRSLGSAWWARFPFNGITRCERGTYALMGGEELGDAEHDQLLELCRQRFDQSPGSPMRQGPLRVLRGS